MERFRKTKIICTLGPASQGVEMMKGLLRSGMNIARFNFSHGDHEYHRQNIIDVRRASVETGIPVALMLDTKGPEIRTGMVKDNGKIKLEQGKELVVTVDECECDEGRICLSYKELPLDVQAGNHILIADGLVDLQILSVEGADMRCVVKAGGEIGSRKNVNVPGVRTRLPAITEKDKADILFAVAEGMDLIAASFIRKAQDVISIQKILAEQGSGIKVISKIEDHEGLENIDEIIRASFGIMVARGDLGVQIDGEQIPLVQKRIIEKCNKAAKPVITATQMLDSMITNPKPTRAELTDVANAIFDGTDAIMLSGETASGKYPLEAVRTMHRIALTIEESEEYKKSMRESFASVSSMADISHAVAKASFMVASDINAESILTPTLSGNTPRLISSFRPEQIIIAGTTRDTTQRQLLLNWGVYPLLTPIVTDSEEMVQNSISAAMGAGLVSMFDKVVVVAGIPIISPIPTNNIRVFFVGNILGRGMKGFGGSTTGRIVKAQSLEEAAILLKKQGGEILVTRILDESFIPIIRCVNGIILEQVSEIALDIVKMANPRMVFVGEVPNATGIFENGITVTLNGEEKLIYEGALKE
jgi:pyruvate kinase